MMAAKLTWEWGERDTEIIISKKRGKITFDELMRFMHEQEQLRTFDGDLVLTMFRVSSQRDMYTYLDALFGEPEGDTLTVQIVQDDTRCPVCGEKRLFPQYCPDCGRKLDEVVRHEHRT